jgi:hypothetical protein
MPVRLDQQTYLANREAFNEDLIYLMKQSCAVQLARVDAYLDGIVLAAEQVQDIRIKLLETPKEQTGWQILGEVALTFALESTIAGKLLRAASKAIFRPVLSQHQVFSALPKQLLSVDGRTLSEAARGLRGTIGPSLSRTVLKLGVHMSGTGGFAQWSRGDITLYHNWLEALARGSDAVGTNLTAALKAANEYRTQDSRAPPPSVGAQDSVGVGVLAAAQHYASVTRLGIQVRYAAFERLVRRNLCTDDELAYLADLVSWQDLELDVGGGRKIASNLGDLRRRYQLLYEALIWGRHFGFESPTGGGAEGRPGVLGERFKGIDKAFCDYWRTRFDENVDQFNADRGKNYKFTSMPVTQQLFDLREYFWKIATELARLCGELKKPVSVQ